MLQIFQNKIKWAVICYIIGEFITLNVIRTPYCYYLDGPFYLMGHLFIINYLIGKNTKETLPISYIVYGIFILPQFFLIKYLQLTNYLQFIVLLDIYLFFIATASYLGNRGELFLPCKLFYMSDLLLAINILYCDCMQIMPLYAILFFISLYLLIVCSMKAECSTLKGEYALC